ncbi:sulfatase family protein [Flexithrix dorotheae]|uniref:sulfatase family protein n=1 Tax=Flexithrix dorotheae TaxID=70993 RepID=UPI0003774A9C|nr:sulfatase [Flexithrix dorotheae]
MNKQSNFILSILIIAAGLYSCNKEGDNNTTLKKPNILFCIADDASFEHMGAYGCSWVKTPGFDRVANEGILFNRAYTPNAKCSPSRSCILTGRNSWQLEEAANHVPKFPSKFKTYFEALKDNGYFTGHTAKGWAPGDPGEINGQKRQLVGPAFNKHTIEPPAKHISGNNYTENFKDFLSQKPEDKPFCFWYGSTEPHRAYEFGAGINKGDKKLEDIDRVPAFWPDNDSVRTDMLDYAFEIEYFDLHLQKMLAYLEEIGELDNTLIVVTSDNGMPFPRIKGQEYELSNHLPLAIMWKNGIKKPGREVNDYVSFIDFVPTFLEVAGLSLEKSGMAAFQGLSLSDIFNSEKSGIVNPKRDHVLIGKERHDVGRPNDWGYPIRGIIKDDMLYIENFETSRWPSGNPETGYLNCDGSPTKTVCLDSRLMADRKKYWDLNFGKRIEEEMYKVDVDRDCMTNLALNASYSELKRNLKEQMYKELQAQEDPRMFGNGQYFDNIKYVDPNTTNFYERYMNDEKMNAGWVNLSDFEENPLD